jgi:hypothetical protein
MLDQEQENVRFFKEHIILACFAKVFKKYCYNILTATTMASNQTEMEASAVISSSLLELGFKLDIFKHLAEDL